MNISKNICKASVAFGKILVKQVQRLGISLRIKCSIWGNPCEASI